MNKLIILHRIKAEKDIYDSKGTLIIKKGQLGGYIENEENLSQEGNCWVGGKAKVYAGGKVIENALVSGLARVYDKGVAKGDSLVVGEASVSDNAEISNFACVDGKSVVRMHSEIKGHSYVNGKNDIMGSTIEGGSIVKGPVRILESKIGNAVCIDCATDSHIIKSEVLNNALIACKTANIEDSTIKDDATLGGFASVCGKSIVSGTAAVADSYILNNSSIGGAAHVNNSKISGFCQVYENARLDGAKIANSEVKGSANIINSDLIGKFIIKDNAKIKNSEIYTDDERIIGGQENLYNNYNVENEDGI